MRQKITLMTLLMLPALVCAEDDKVARLRKAADEVGQAVLKEKHEKVIELTHPKVVELIGGRDKMLQTLRDISAALKEQGIEFDSIKFEAPEKIIGSGKHEFSVVPYVLRIRQNEATLKQRTYLLAVTPDAGKTWWFINGPIPDKMRQAIPDFPEKLELPKEEKATVERKK